MRVFVTGATGYIGSEVVRELIDAGHKVIGLTRLDKGVLKLKEAGAEVHQGSLDHLDSLRSGAAIAALDIPRSSVQLKLEANAF
ncbi:NAD-dependent epimerase/dehydratase family protein [Clostridium intestinale]|uniref:NmrA family NAD(P)-binding protein n=1 Tax=Clostridium intestinale TaxID=36845 RepID=UPI001A9BE1D3|nr:NAD-dependent epimerase/dehydratase family protein [Clostridium intestinale]